MDTLERIKKVIKEEKLKRDDLVEKTGINYTRWQSVISGKAKVRMEDIEGLATAFPEYGYWLAFGKELPQAGQISPMTKKAQRDYRETGTDS